MWSPVQPGLAFVCVSLLSLSLTSGLLESEPMHGHLYNCLDTETKNISVSAYPAASIMHSCIQSYLSYTADQRMHHNVTDEFLAKMSSYLRKFLSHRHKRQAPGRRVRREIRRLSADERGRLFAALNVLKNNGMYDEFASYHQGRVSLLAAHNGPNFLGWHRVYLYMLEEALREVDPSVTLPYWDSSIDFDMDDPIRSVLWTSEFFGNGNGFVTTGPFRFWRTLDNGILTRNIGSSGASLMQKRLIDNIINFNNNIDRTLQIVVWRDQPPWLRQNVLERQHDGAHAWVGGHMRGLPTAANDPVFFFHHCFIDYIWEQFRIKQSFRGINPAADYPPDRFLTDRPLHFGNRIMINFSNFRNYHGFGDISNIYSFERTPQCPFCGSDYLYCDFSRYVCVSVDRSFVGENMATAMGSSGPNSFGQPGGLPLGDTFEPSFFDSRSRSTPLGTRPRDNGPLAVSVGGSSNRRDINRSGNFGDANASGNMRWDSTIGTTMQNFQSTNFGNLQQQPTSDRMGSHFSMYRVKDNKMQNMYLKSPGSDASSTMSSSIDNGIQNTFSLDGVTDVNRWAFMPVRIVHKRPADVSFNSQIVSNGLPLPNTDFYNPSNYNKLKSYMQPGSPATIPKCSNYGSGAQKVYVEASGMNYAGSYKDYAMIDQRQPVMEAFTYIGIKNPSRGMSRTFLHAYDSSGRVCQPRCLQRNSNPPKYIPCSGAIRASSDNPSMYGNTYGDAVLGRWNMKNNQCPNSNNGNVFMTFYCEYSNSWPWKDCPYQKEYTQ